MEEEKGRLKKEIIELIDGLDDVCVLTYFYNFIKGKLKAWPK